MLKKRLKMFVAILELLWYRIRKGEWYAPEITVDKLFKRFNSTNPPLILDVRSSKEFSGKKGHIPSSKSIPFMELDEPASLNELTPFKESEIITICPGGGLSLIAADVLAEEGFKDVKSLKGGLDLWREKGYPTEYSQ
jgi:rhodanese-related sulfurtransferase